MLTFTLMKPEGILRLHPSGPLTEQDFERLRTEVDAYLMGHARLNGVLVRAAEFPGWENWAGFSAHMHFVHAHHTRVERIALVTDSAVAGLGEFLAEHFTSAEVRRFPLADERLAMQWLQAAS